jgi:hypothetical protein
VVGVDCDLAELRRREGEVFGSADDGKGLVLAVSPAGSYQGKQLLLPQHRGDRRAESPSAAIPTGTRVELRLRPARRHGADALLAVGAASMWIALHLGGVGQRSRRGAGSFCTESLVFDSAPRAIGLTALAAPLQAKDVAALAEGLREPLRTAISIVRNGAIRAIAERADARFPTFGQSARVQVVALQATDEQAARAEVMLGLRPFKNAVFGLPYMKPAPNETPIAGRNVRHASPLWIHVHPLATGGFAAVQTALRSTTLPAGPQARWGRVQEYLDSFSGRCAVGL